MRFICPARGDSRAQHPETSWIINYSIGCTVSTFTFRLCHVGGSWWSKESVLHRLVHIFESLGCPHWRLQGFGKIQSVQIFACEKMIKTSDLNTFRRCESTGVTGDTVQTSKDLPIISSLWRRPADISSWLALPLIGAAKWIFSAIKAVWGVNCTSLFP